MTAGESYTVRRRDEEGECDWCASPLYVGDRAYLFGDGFGCSKDHARKGQQARDEAYRSLVRAGVLSK